MNSFFATLSHPTVDRIIDLKRLADTRKTQAAYNLFTLSSYNNHLENFHSDVLHSLLDPRGEHGEGYLFLNLFIQYLNKYFKLNIIECEFRNVVVQREQGRIDIWVHDTYSLKNIIIENKINDAADMDDQLERYYQLVNHRHGKIEAIIYLSLNGLKKAPQLPKGIDSKLCNLAAFADVENDIVSGWLNICESSCTNEDSRSLIFQYIKLLKQLSHQSMNTATEREFYEYFASEEKLRHAKTLVELLNNLPTYRRDLFHKSITDFGPFRNSYLYPSRGNRASLFENYRSNGVTFKLDVWFKEDGSAQVWFWIPSHREENQNIGYELLTQKLSSINMLAEFKEEELTYIRDFTLNSYPRIPELDFAVLSFVQSFFKALRFLEGQRE